MTNQNKAARLILAAALAGLACHAGSAERPAVIGKLEREGLAIAGEFKAGGGLRAFAGSAGGQPVAVYVAPDGSAIVGTRLGPDGQPVDEAKLRELVAGPLGEAAWKRLQAAKWVADGKAGAPRIVYVFSDANCPYCHRFSAAARPWVAAGKVQLRHVLVGIIKEDSAAKAAAILSAPNPSAALLDNEKRPGGIAPLKSVPADLGKALAANQMLMLEMGFHGTPGIVVRDSQGGVRKFNGVPRPEALPDILGPR